jgi:hypothetical protein
LKYIKTPGLEIRALLSNVRNDVIEATGEKQVPWENSSLRGNVYLRPPLEEAAPDKPDDEQLYWQSVQRIGTKAAFLAYKERFGDNGRFSRLADERIAGLPAAKPQSGPFFDEPPASPAPLAKPPAQPPREKRSAPVANIEPPKLVKPPRPARVAPAAPLRAKQVEPRRQASRPKSTAQKVEVAAPRSAPRAVRSNAGSCFTFQGRRMCE